VTVVRLPNPQLLQLLRDNVTANIDTVFSAIRHSIPVEHVKAPTAALEYARRLAQRDVSANALVRAYRIGHQEVLKILLEEIRASELDPAPCGCSCAQGRASRRPPGSFTCTSTR
jgi:hypothetical protein